MLADALVENEPMKEGALQDERSSKKKVELENGEDSRWFESRPEWNKHETRARRT